VKVSAGFAAGVRGKAAARLGPFMDAVRGLLREAGVLYADETVRHEAPCDRAEVKRLRRPAVAAAGLKLRAA